MTYAPNDLLTVCQEAGERRKVGRLAFRQRQGLLEYAPDFIAAPHEAIPRATWTDKMGGSYSAPVKFRYFSTRSIWLSDLSRRSICRAPTLRWTHSTLMRQMKADDQFGHTVDVNLNVYPQSPVANRQVIVNELERYLVVN